MRMAIINDDDFRRFLICTFNVECSMLSTYYVECVWEMHIIQLGIFVHSIGPGNDY